MIADGLLSKRKAIIVIELELGGTQRLRVLCIDHEGGHGGSSRSLIQLLSALQQQNSINCEVWFRRKGPIENIYRDLKIRCKHVPEIPTFTTVHQCTRNLLSLFRCVFGIMASFPTLIRMARQIGKEFDLVHFNHPNLWVLALLLKTIVKCPFTFHIRVSLKKFKRNSKRALDLSSK